MMPRLWLTRPTAQAADTAQAFSALGFDVLPVPVLEIRPLADADSQQRIRSQILDFDQYDAAIFVSQNAARLGAGWLADFWPQLPLHSRLLAVGAATAQCLREAELPTVGAPALDSAMNSEALLALPELQQLEHRKVLILRGRGGRTLLGDSLAARGARVDYCELYERAVPAEALDTVRAALARGPAWLSVHSGESLANLCQLLDALQAAVRHWPILVPGERVAALAAERGFSHILCALNASDAAMTRALADALQATER